MPDRWTLRAGVYYETAAAPAAYANVDFPGRAGAGRRRSAGRCCCGRSEIALTYQLRYQPSFTVSEADARFYQQVPTGACAAPYTDPSSLQPELSRTAGPTVNAGTYAATSHLVSLALIYRYGR